jgi:hypothetical protein
VEVPVEVAEEAEVGAALQGLGLDVQDDVENRVRGVRTRAAAEAAIEVGIRKSRDRTVPVRIGAVEAADGLARAGRLTDAPVDVDRLCDLSAAAPAWDPPSTRLRIGDPGGDELVERRFRRRECWPDDLEASPALRLLRDQATALWAALAAGAGPADFSLARRYCVLHAAACCLQVWRSNRERLASEAAGGEWLALCLERLAGELAHAAAAAPNGKGAGPLGKREAEVCGWSPTA